MWQLGQNQQSCSDSVLEGGQHEDGTRQVFSTQWNLQPHVLPLLWQEGSGSVHTHTHTPQRGSFCDALCFLPQVNYTQPLVAVKFLNASLNSDISVECNINSNTLAEGSERDKFAGRVSFKLRINDK